MNHARQIQLTALINHIISLSGIVYVVTNGQLHWLLIGIIIFIVTMILCVNISLHRFISHRSFTTGPKREKFLKYISILAAFGSPISWAAMHRYHHMHSGSKYDNQSPKNIGYVRAWCTLYDSVTIPANMVKDVFRDKDYQFIHKNYFKILYTYAIILFLIDPLVMIFCFSFPAMLMYQAAGAFAVIPHSQTFGYKVLDPKGEDDSVNSPLASLLSLGEGWHNYHHNRSTDHRHGHLWWEIDPPAWVIEKFFIINDR
jgi:stearoyl-CoA desaturase (delta-9 desaturase)